jgi:hypothetical protein
LADFQMVLPCWMRSFGFFLLPYFAPHCSPHAAGVKGTFLQLTGSGLESREYGRRDSSRWPRGTLNPQKVFTNFADKRRSLGR